MSGCNPDEMDEGQLQSVWAARYHGIMVPRYPDGVSSIRRRNTKKNHADNGGKYAVKEDNRNKIPD